MEGNPVVEEVVSNSPLVSAILAGDTKEVQNLMNSSCKCDHFFPMGAWPETMLPLFVMVSTKDKKDAALVGCIGQKAVHAVNNAIGAEVLSFVDMSLRGDKEQKKTSVWVCITMDFKHGNGHAVTEWNPDWHKLFTNGGGGGKQPKKITIPLRMRKKDNVLIRRRTLEYFSTLTHELIHCLGMAHFPLMEQYRGEIMFPGHGGTTIGTAPPELEEVPLKENEYPTNLRKSPFTIDALRWCYNNSGIPLVNKTNGKPVYCNVCKTLGWHWE